MLKGIPKQEYTAEFKELSVKRVKAGQSMGGNWRHNVAGLEDENQREGQDNKPSAPVA